MNKRKLVLMRCRNIFGIAVALWLLQAGVGEAYLSATFLNAKEVGKSTLICNGKVLTIQGTGTKREYVVGDFTHKFSGTMMLAKIKVLHVFRGAAPAEIDFYFFSPLSEDLTTHVILSEDSRYHFFLKPDKTRGGYVCVRDGDLDDGIAVQNLEPNEPDDTPCVIHMPAARPSNYIMPDGIGNSDGMGAAARFYGPNGVTVDASGNVFVADTGNSTIRKIAPGGVVTTFAGVAGEKGASDGTGSAARFNGPNGVAVDAEGNVFVADTDNSSIRKITSSGVVTTLAGGYGTGSSDGTGADAEFNGPVGVAVDGNGNLFVADTGNSTIRKITSSGVVTTLAGIAGETGNSNGTGNAARFNTPNSVAVDGNGILFVADSGNHNIRRITLSGAVTTLAGRAGTHGFADGTGSAAQFSIPSGVAVSGNGYIYVADIDSNKLRKITPAGVVTSLSAGWMIEHGVRTLTPYGMATTLAGDPGGTQATGMWGGNVNYNNAISVAVDSRGDIYFANIDTNSIRKFTPRNVGAP